VNSFEPWADKPEQPLKIVSLKNKQIPGNYYTAVETYFHCLSDIKKPVIQPVAGILVDLGHPQSRSSKSILNGGTMSVPTFQTFFGTTSEGVIENQCCQLFLKFLA
jgi:hypothetical protein